MGDFGILGLIHLAIWVYAVVQIFGSSAKTEIKFLWILIGAVLPLVGIIIWYFMGPGSPKKG
jgi:energy-coupling factor transporter transmembrane protein EcfT